MEVGITVAVILVVGVFYTNYCRQRQLQTVDARIEQIKVNMQRFPDEAEDLQSDLAFELEVKKSVNGWNDLIEIERRVTEKLYPQKERKV